MRSIVPIGVAALVAVITALPVGEARAGLSVAASLGQGYQLSEPKGREATTIMVAPGFDLLDLLRVELGIVGAFSAVQQSNDTKEWGLQLRPMLVLAPPVLPIYGRLVVASIRPFSDTRSFAYGGAAGMSLSLGPLGVFGEVGVLPRSINDQISWVLEGRAGVLIVL